MTTERERNLIILGSGTSHGVPMIGCVCEVCLSENPRNKRMRSGALIEAPEGNILIDTSPELRMQLLREKVRLVHAAIYTHSHADHLFGLDDLRLFGHYLDGPVALYCEENVERQIRKSYSYAFDDSGSALHPGAVPHLEIHRIHPQPFQLCGETITPIRLLHGKLPVLGFRIRNVAFCTDVSEIPEASFPLLEGLDTLVIDALREKPHATHFSVGQALEVIARVKPRQAYLTHISHTLDHDRTNGSLPDGVEMAYDGLRIRLN
ncbi:MAG: MBL fold metallo-hydrolase [Planctomycetaceae bacterium]|nr:MBL fold metallo-hydrolase [Planctomycetaceae bacterium]